MLVLWSALALAAPLSDADAWRQLEPLLSEAVNPQQPVSLSPSKLPPETPPPEIVYVGPSEVRLRWGTRTETRCGRTWQYCTADVLQQLSPGGVSGLVIAVDQDAPLWQVGLVANAVASSDGEVTFLVAADVPALPDPPDAVFDAELRTRIASDPHHRRAVLNAAAGKESLCPAYKTNDQPFVDYVAENCEDGGARALTRYRMVYENAVVTASVSVRLGEGRPIKARPDALWRDVEAKVLKARGQPRALQFPAPPVLPAERVSESWYATLYSLCESPTSATPVPTDTELELDYPIDPFHFRADGVTIRGVELSCADVMAATDRTFATKDKHSNTLSLQLDADANMACVETALRWALNGSDPVDLRVYASGTFPTVPPALDGPLALEVPPLNARAAYVADRADTLASCPRQPVPETYSRGKGMWCDHRITALRTYDVGRCEAAFHTELVDILPHAVPLGFFSVREQWGGDNVLESIADMSPEAFVAWLAAHRSAPVTLRTAPPTTLPPLVGQIDHQGRKPAEPGPTVRWASDLTVTGGLVAAQVKAVIDGHGEKVRFCNDGMNTYFGDEPFELTVAVEVAQGGRPTSITMLKAPTATNKATSIATSCTRGVLSRMIFPTEAAGSFTAHFLFSDK